MDNRYLGKLAGLLSMCSILMVGARYSSVGAQQTGPGGVPSGNSGGAVASVFGRTGAVAAASGDYTAAQVTNAAATNAANTFTTNQTISSATPTLTLYDTGPSQGASIYSQFGGLAFSANGTTEAIYSSQHQIISSEVVCWTSQLFFTPCDTAISRVSAGVIAAGNGTHDDASGWLQSSAIGNGATGNTDLRGHVTLAGGAASYTFVLTYTVAPTCVATDSTSAAAVKVFSTTTTLTLTGTGNDIINYICAD